MVKAGRGVALQAYPVSTLVNRASVDTPELIEPVEVKTSRQRRLFDVER
jgi:putative SOS response-associated peptidase YedK